jgi:hypothetical protein
MSKGRLKRRAIVAYRAECEYCRGRGNEDTGPDGRSWHLDRWWPGKEGGRYTASNVVLSCHACNLYKGGKDPNLLSEAFHAAIPLDGVEVIRGGCHAR